MPEQPDWIPYRTSYYKEDWGFCLSERQARTLTDAAYRVVIDATLGAGPPHLWRAGDKGRERGRDAGLVPFLPPLARQRQSLGHRRRDDAGAAADERRRGACTYRFLFIPGTIGSLAWLAANEARVPRVTHGLVLSCVGDPGGFTYKQSRRGNAEIDRIVAHVLRHGGAPHRIAALHPLWL